MSFSQNPMSPTLLLLLLLTPFLIFTPTNTHDEESFISLLISQKGLNFAKDLLISQAISSLTPLQLPTIEEPVHIPIAGDVHVTLWNITLYKVGVRGSYIKPGDIGVGLVVSGATANLSMDWGYSYKSWLVDISYHGHVSVQVEGMEVGLTLGLENQEGTLKLSLMDCGCYVKDMSIILDGGASWFYQWLVDAFEGQIRSAVENAITQKLKEGVSELDSSLQTLPKEVPVDDVAALNATFISAPLLSNSSIGFEINGLFIPANKGIVRNYNKKSSQPLVLCEGAEKMLEISLDEAVFNSGSAVYFRAGVLQWIVDRVPEQSLLKTSSWKYIVPQLYKKYPDDDMSLNVTLSSPPVLQISSPNKIDATIYSDITIDVLDSTETIPVACISLEISASGSMNIRGNNLAGRIKLEDFTMSLKWSNIGNFHMSLIQSVMRTFLKTMAFPYANTRLIKGFPLPILNGFTLQNAKVFCTNSRIVICSDIVYTKSYNPLQLPIYGDVLRKQTGRPASLVVL